MRLFLCALAVVAAVSYASAAPESIGGRLELLVDDYLLESFSGAARLELHHPQRQEIVLKTDAPWEGNASAFQSVFRDGDGYRMYYRGLHYLHSGEEAQSVANHPWYLCLALSDDGIHWTRPNLGLFEFNGTKDNNLVLTPEMLAEIGGDPAHTSAYKDTNPACPPEERYKITIVGSKPTGMYVLKSADGAKFSLLSKEPLVTDGAFDSQNLMFWDNERGEYREYHRGFAQGVRAIMTSASKTLTPFPPPVYLEYKDVLPEHLYTNAIIPYYRAPHLFMGFPMRYTDRGWSQPVLDLPRLDERLARVKGGDGRYGTAVTDSLFMTSRDGLTFKRWPEAFIRPGPRQKHSWVYGDNFVFWGILETPSVLADAPNELSLYTVESYWEGTGTEIRRHTIRVDGFVSAYAPMSGGEVLTRPFTFTGGNLALNYETSGAGSVQVEVQDEAGKPVEGYALAECPALYGDQLRAIVRWEKPGGDLRALEGKAVRLRFVLKDADVYSLQFVPYEPEPPIPVIPGLIPRKTEGRAAFVALADDFEAGPAGVAPTVEDLDPPKKEEGTTWEVREGAPDRVQVLSNEPPGGAAGGASKYLSLERRDEKRAEGGIAWLVLAPQEAADSTDGVVELKLRVWVPATNGSLVDIGGFDSQPEEFRGRAFQVRFAKTGAVTYYDGEQDQPVPGVALKTDAWQQVTVRADFRAGTFDLTVEGQTATGLPFSHAGVRRLQAIGIGPNSGSSRLCLDDVRLEIIP